MAAKVKVDISSELLNLYWADPVGPLFREVERRALNVQGAIRREAPKHTGLLAATVTKQPPRYQKDVHNQVVATINVGSPTLTPYLGYVVYGTEPHVITPRGAHFERADYGPLLPGQRGKKRRVQNKALRFVSGGQVRFATRVYHPGTAANDFITRGLQLGFAV